jgi:hypothetical protein
MRVSVHDFRTEAEAEAFALGVDTYSRDGIESCRQKRQQGLRFQVAVHDYRPIGPDGEPFDDPFDTACVIFPQSKSEDDICPLCGSSGRADTEEVSDE